jgi:hypothetical protein
MVKMALALTVIFSGRHRGFRHVLALPAFLNAPVTGKQLRHFWVHFTVPRSQVIAVNVISH